ncbi:valine--tRNA ligase [Terasakiella sp. A23]|uniref:valine--tRNA ligase n=1 Tax=Terasakiella sp. FCG-A23 TaxID=3080561 RepID=UPI002953C0B6|nr:valine--tRNA ligase [Terasakiella sp. A23]MDV7338751.1 valine--tRNA ligase [Terasakiella sp. A23]
MLDKKFNPAAVEEKHYKLWEENNAFAANHESGKDPYTIMMPPPNVTGSLHMGHALTFTLQDILIRYNRMKGKDSLWQPGTDHAGIATQMVVERRLEGEGVTRHDLGRDKFIDKIWEWKEESGGTIVQQLRRLGASADWAKERFTMDEGLSEAVRKVFVELYKDDLIYRDKKLVNWDPKLHTAISDLEVEQRETNGKMWYFNYPIEGENGKYIMVGTTRPETMLGDTGVAVHPDDERYKDLVGKNVILPIVNRAIPIVADEYADPEKGSGAVKITPGHDFNDYDVGKRCNLEIINVLDLNANLNENVPEKYQGMERFEARKQIVAEMEELGLLVKIEENPMTVPYGDRSGVVIEPWLTDQWFVKADVLAKPALEAVETGKTRFVPKQWENTYYEWMRNIQPWCISRQIWWGHQIPAWFDEDGNVYVELTEEDAQKAAGEGVKLTRETDVLDTWFSSALWPFSTLGWPEKTPELENYYTTDVLVTGFDIIFFWVARMMMMGIHFMGEVPFKDVYIHALVRDEQGAKMSKSKGNVIDPLEMIDEFGADAMRFTLTAMAAQGRDIKLAKSRVEGYRNFATKLWNAARFCQMNGCKPVAGFDAASVKHPVNRWIVGKVGDVAAEVGQQIDDYRFNESANAIYGFAWGTFCDWYLEFTKPILNGSDEAAIEETKATTAWVLDQILHILHPSMPYITEELWESMADERANQLISGAWPTKVLDDADANDEMDWLVNLISTIRTTRSELNVPGSVKLDVYLHGASEVTGQRLERNMDLILRMARLEKIELVDEAMATGCVQEVVNESTVFINVVDHMDVAAEKARLEKEIANLDKIIGGKEKKLSNEKFVNNAPAEVVATERTKVAELTEKNNKFKEALERLVSAL